MSQASNWLSHTGNSPDTWVAGRTRQNHIGTRCAILMTHTGSVWMRNSRLSKSKMRLDEVEYETWFHIEALKSESWVSRLAFSMLIWWLRLDFWWKYRLAIRMAYRVTISGKWDLCHDTHLILCVLKRRPYMEWQLTFLSLITVWPYRRWPFNKVIVWSQGLMLLL